MNRELHIALIAPFEPHKIKWRIGSRTKDKKKGMALAYIDARDVMQRLDTVVGPDNWQDSFPHAGCCELSLRLDGEWIRKSDCAGETQVEAEKGEASGAFKRAASKWGIGRYLYYLDSPWVQLENGYMPRNFVGQLPKWALPENWIETYNKTYNIENTKPECSLGIE
jgi:hypothetical protein